MMKHNRLLLGLLTAGMLLPAAAAQTTEELTNPEPGDWPTYGRTLDMQRYSPLDGINSENVDDLTVAWTRDLDVRGKQQASPVVYDGVMYINGINAEVLALDATNGELIWEYQATLAEEAGDSGAMRGSVVVYDGKVFYAQRDASVVALDSSTGEELWKTSVGNPAWSEGFSAGPIFADGKIIVGPNGADAGGQPGRVLALDSENGEILWTFNIIPGPEDEEAYATWDTPPDPERGIGGGSPWTPGAYDPVTRTIIYGTGQPTPWDHFDERRGEPTADLYTSGTVAIDVDTGELKWYFQTVPGDEWDYDQHPTPTVADLTIDGEERRVVINPTTSGYIEILDADTGEFLAGHQMYPDPNVHLGYEEDGTPIIDQDQRWSESGEYRELRPFRWVNFEPGSFSPETGLYYRPNNHDVNNVGLYALPDDWERGDSAVDRDRIYVTDHHDRFGGVSAIDPTNGEVVWEYTHGYRQSGGGVVATAGDVVFGAFPDRVFRAFDAETGDVLWEQVLHAAMESAPITYEVDGTQYVAQIAGTTDNPPHQEGLPDVVHGSSVVWVFALPE